MKVKYQGKEYNTDKKWTSTEGLMASVNSCFPAAEKFYKNRYCDRHDFFIINDRAYCFFKTRSGFFWMDAVTGSLYDYDGNCMSSDVLKIDINKAVHDNKRGREILMNLRRNKLTCRLEN